MVGFVIPIVLVLTFQYAAFRYRGEFYAFLDFTALLGFYVLSGKDHASPAKVNKKFGGLLLWSAVIGIIASHFLLIGYKLSPFGNAHKFPSSSLVKDYHWRFGSMIRAAFGEKDRLNVSRAIIARSPYTEARGGSSRFSPSGAFPLRHPERTAGDNWAVAAQNFIFFSRAVCEEFGQAIFEGALGAQPVSGARSLARSQEKPRKVWEIRGFRWPCLQRFALEQEKDSVLRLFRLGPWSSGRSGVSCGERDRSGVQNDCLPDSHVLESWGLEAFLRGLERPAKHRKSDTRSRALGRAPRLVAGVE
jgi:hypothetical protein